jgi:hypothetical protein
MHFLSVVFITTWMFKANVFKDFGTVWNSKKLENKWFGLEGGGSLRKSHPQLSSKGPKSRCVPPLTIQVQFPKRYFSFSQFRTMDKFHKTCSCECSTWTSESFRFYLHDVALPMVSCRYLANLCQKFWNCTTFDKPDTALQAHRAIFTCHGIFFSKNAWKGTRIVGEVWSNFTPMTY